MDPPGSCVRVGVHRALCCPIVGCSGAGGGPVQEDRQPSRRSATQVGGHHDERVGYTGGKWIEVRYGRPIRRGRSLYGPPDFAQILNDGAPVWRAGANQSTQLITELPLVIGGVEVAPGSYTLFIELRRDHWTFIVSRWPAQERYQQNNRDALFGAFHYRPTKTWCGCR